MNFAGASRFDELRRASLELVQDWPVPIALPLPVEPGQPSTFGQRVTLVQGSDEIVVTAAQFDVEAAQRSDELLPSVNGTAITFPTEVRLTHIELKDDVTDDNNPTEGDTDPLHLVIRSATPSGNDYVAGPPLYAIPPFPAGMFGTLLGGATKSGPVISFPPIAGSAFVLQTAKGSSALTLVEESSPAIAKVKVNAVPRDVTIAVAGNAPRAIWGHGGPLLPGAKQTVSFVPAAQSALSAGLAAASEQTKTLDLALNAISTSSGTLRVSNARLEGTFFARPVDQPRRVPLRGSLEPVTLDLPAGVRPSSATLSLSARFLGRELNDAHEAMPDRPPDSGLRVHPARSAAVFAPLVGAPLSMASVRLPLIAFGDSEVAVELHAAATALPGQLLAPHGVRQLAAGFRGWCEIVLPQPLALTGDGLWIVLRATKGEVLWCTGEDAERSALTSTDGGTTWSEPAALLGARVVPLVQLFHVADTPPAVKVELQAGDVRHTWLLTRVANGIDFEATAEFPPSLLTMIGETKGTGRTKFDVRLFCDSALDLNLDGITFSYPLETQVF